MGLLFSKLWSLLSSQKDCKVVIVGLDNAGKTTILYKLFSGKSILTSPTVGSNVEEITYKKFKFIMWDLGGQDALRMTWKSYFLDTKFIILVIDSSDRERLVTVKKELEKILKNEDLVSCNILIFANKQDKENAMTIEEITAYMNLIEIKEHNWHIQPCCALNGNGLTLGLDYLTSRLDESS